MCWTQQPTQFSLFCLAPMSWISEIANKTENFLNKLDDNAAAALNSNRGQRDPRYSGLRIGKERIDHGSNEGDNSGKDALPSRDSLRNDSLSRFHSRQSSSSSVAAAANIFPTVSESHLGLDQIQVQMSDERLRLADMERQCRRLQQKEMDLLESLRSKDAQLAVLRVRLEETDEETKCRQSIISRLQKENEGLLKSSTEASGQEGGAVHCLQERIRELELRLQEGERAAESTREEHDRRLSEIQSARETVSGQLVSLQQQLVREQGETGALKADAEKWRVSAERAHSELADYKNRAHSILSSKDELINTLRQHSSSSGSAVAASAADNSISNAEESAEYQWLTAECSTLRAEVAQQQQLVRQLELQQVEAGAGHRQQLSSCQFECQQLKEKLDNEQRLYSDSVSELQHQQKLLRDLRVDIQSEKVKFDTLLQEKDEELEKLRRRIAIKSAASSSELELEERMRALTDNLIRKQTCIETLSTEKHSLSVQLERCQNELSELQQVNSSKSTAVSDSYSRLSSRHCNADNQPDSYSSAFASAPFTGRVHRAYNRFDQFSVMLGFFFRRYPTARNFLVAYMVLLHLWLLIVLYSRVPNERMN